MSIEDEMVDLGTKFQTSEVNNTNLPVLGMKFGSPDEAFQFYKQYSCKMGFGITRRTSHKLFGIKYDVTFSCNKNRKPSQKVDGEVSGKYSRRIVGTGCRAKIILRDHKLIGSWEIIEVVLDHNHELQPDCIRLMRGRREIPLFVKKQLEINELVGLSQNKFFSAVSTQVGGRTHCQFTQKDKHNYISEIHCLDLREGDADALTEFFCLQQVQCPNFFYSVNLDNNGRLMNVFWADARSRSAFKYFGDVVAFDSTYLTNRYRIPLTMFIGANHHRESILLGCALLGNEFKETYVWLFRTFLSCMHKAPNAIITDQCDAISFAVSEVFPQARHGLCLWQIMKKLPKKLAGVEDRDGVMQAVCLCVYDSTNPGDFESHWSELMKNFNLGESYDWFSGLYEMREKWVPIFIKPFFWAGMGMIQFGKQFFDRYINSRTSLKAFLEKYDAAMQSKWEKEKQEDCQFVDEFSKMISNCRFEKQFAAAYTLKMFLLFQKELQMLIGCSCELVVVKDSYHHYSVSDFSKKKSTVRYFTITQEYFCDCMSFEFRGIVCCHGLCVYRQLGIDVLPDKYVINRWRKDYMKSHFPKVVKLPAMCNNIDRSRLLDTDEDPVECTSLLPSRRGSGCLNERPSEPALKDPILVCSKGRPRTSEFKSTPEKGHRVKTQKVSSRKKANKMAEQKDDGGTVTDKTLSRNITCSHKDNPRETTESVPIPVLDGVQSVSWSCDENVLRATELLLTLKLK